MNKIICLGVVLIFVVGWIAFQIHTDMVTWQHAVIDKHTQEVAQ